MTSPEEDAAFVRQSIIRMARAPCGAHVGGALSCTDILIALYREIMSTRPAEPEWPGRDFFILSKGHAAPALYATLALCGFIQHMELETYGQPGTRLGGHPKRSIPGVEFATGSLGHGLSLGVGMCMKLSAQAFSNDVYVLLGDGELQEGMVWEAAQSAGRYRLSHLTALVDCNHLQINGATDVWLPKDALRKRWESYGWNVYAIDGHNHEQIILALRQKSDGPKVILAETVKAKGIDFMENKKKSHHVYLTPSLYDRALVSIAR